MSGHAAANQGDRSQLFLLLASAVLLIRTLGILPLLFPIAGLEEYIPAGATLIGAAIGASWMVSTVVLLLLRKWIGAVSAYAFCAFSVLNISAAVTSGYALWAGWLILNTTLIFVFVTFAIVNRAFGRSRRAGS